ncbi:MAG: DUF1206 domain-containing protein [Jatrophihabitans sp.]|uniref:DUF1206 domain-containing protein n=1 Tax=Jatrophihabitans sp. TaxID=1932789 RepID=UPI003F815A4B
MTTAPGYATTHPGRRGAAEVRGAAAGIERQPWWPTAVRAGIGARAVAFLVLAYLIARIAGGALGDASGDQPASQQGVAQAVAQQGGGHVLVFLLGLGVLLYAAFSAVDALLHHDEPKPRKRWAKRLNSAWAAGLYLFFGVYCLRAAFSDAPKRTSGQQHQQQAQWTAKVLGWPGGQFWLFLVAVAVLGGAVFVLVRAVQQKFRKYLDEQRMSPRVRGAALGLGTAGHIGRAALYGLAGSFVLSAAIEDDPKNGKGFDGAARAVANNTAGAALLWVIAVLILAFALYLCCEARFRRV